jgi:anti-sigma factor RsiW
MICAQSRRLFGAFWDDEITQAERESLEAHFASCPGCREEYDLYSRAVELATTLPRIEPAPDLVERALARARRVSPAPDRVGAPGFPWVPVTATAALVAVAFTVVSPWLGTGNVPIALRPGVTQAPVGQPELRRPVALSSAASKTAVPGARGASLGHPGVAGDPIAAVPDSLFDHSEDVEFILDPMTLRRGRPATLRAGGNIQGQQATITF